VLLNPRYLDFDQRACATLRAASLRSADVSFSARGLPPFSPPFTPEGDRGSILALVGIKRWRFAGCLVHDLSSKLVRVGSALA
jgi:hypothetical protein